MSRQSTLLSNSTFWRLHEVLGSKGAELEHLASTMDLLSNNAANHSISKALWMIMHDAGHGSWAKWSQLRIKF